MGIIVCILQNHTFDESESKRQLVGRRIGSTTGRGGKCSQEK